MAFICASKILQVKSLHEIPFKESQANWLFIDDSVHHEVPRALRSEGDLFETRSKGKDLEGTLCSACMPDTIP